MPTPHQSFFTGWMLFLTPNQQRQSTDTCVLYSMFAIFSESNKHLWLEALASTPPGMPGTHPPIFWLGGRQREYPPILLRIRTFGYSRTILVALRSFSLKPISFGYKTPQIRFSQAGGQWAHKARPHQPCTRVDATGLMPSGRGASLHTTLLRRHRCKRYRR